MQGVNVACTIDDEYVEHCAVMLRSLAVNNTQLRIRVFIISPGLSEHKKSKLAHFLAGFCSDVTFINIDQSVLAGAPISHHVSLATYLRLLIPGVIDPSIQKLLFLDADIVIRRDINPLWDLKLEGYSHAAAENPGISPEYKQNLGLGQKPYFNAGVMLINLEAWRSLDLTKKALEFIRQYPERINYWDQDALNYVLRDHWLRIDAKWNAQHAIFGTTEPDELGLREEEFHEAKNDPAIVHFSGSGLCKPWYYHCRHPFKQEYYRYRSQTPWPRFRPLGKRTISQKLYSKASKWLRPRLG